jgi:hypothetical protein
MEGDVHLVSTALKDHLFPCSVYLEHIPIAQEMKSVVSAQEDTTALDRQ